MPAPNATAIQDAKDDLERLVNRRNAIEERLNQIKAGHQIDARPVEEVVAEAMTVIAQQRDQLATAHRSSPTARRRSS